MEISAENIVSFVEKRHVPCIFRTKKSRFCDSEFEASVVN